MCEYEALKLKLKEHGQEHLLGFWSELSDVEKHNLYGELNNLDLGHISEAFKRCTEDCTNTKSLDERLAPPADDSVGSVARTDPEILKSYETTGLEVIANGKVGVLLLAGGQGTRLGVQYPKGMYDVGLPSRKSLYHLQAQRIIKLEQLAKQRHGKHGTIPWYIMTSEQTREPTEDYFKRNKYFGLQSENVIFFEQSTMPCLDFQGKIILETKSSIAKAPDGNGGLYSALRRCKIVDNIVERKIEYLHVYCVDNILVKMADPVFIGFAIAKKANCAAKVVEKKVPTEAVGVICRLDGKYHVVEYSEISTATAEKKNDRGQLLFHAGGIANHLFTTDFLKTIVDEKERTLKYHVAKKKIPFCSVGGQVVRPTEPNGIKLEKFVFDIFEFSNAFAVWEVLREDEFAPLKNADPEVKEGSKVKDTPTTSRQALLDLHKRWVERAGGKFAANIPSNGVDVNNCHNCEAGDTSKSGDGNGSLICEISPLVSYFGEGLEELVKGKLFTSPLNLYGEGETK